MVLECVTCRRDVRTASRRDANWNRICPGKVRRHGFGVGKFDYDDRADNCRNTFHDLLDPQTRARVGDYASTSCAIVTFRDELPK